MPFPDIQRVLFKHNPLERVICQLRFPPILKIDTNVPADFQDKIRARFPDFTENTEWEVEWPHELREKVPAELIGNTIQRPGLKNYQFSVDNDMWQVNLTRNFMSLSTTDYRRWEVFKEYLDVPFMALNEVYNPANFTRIGLRYINVIKRSELGLEKVDWKNLIQPHILGMLSSPDVGNHIRQFENKYELALEDDNGSVRIITKLVRAVDTGEVCFMIDSDFYTSQKTATHEVVDKLDFFNRRSSRLIQWSISDRLYAAMEPEQL